MRTTVLGLVVSMIAGLAPARLAAQYFGQNKVRYETLDFKVLKTQHFDIHYYPEERDAAVETGRLAERWHARLGKVLNHTLSPNQPIVLYASHPAFRGTTAIQGFIGETTGGVTEALRRRLVMPLAGPMAETDHVLGHELVHAYQFDIASRSTPSGGAGLPGILSLPLWFVEGMAEYLSLGPLDPLTAMWLRDAVRREEIPAIKDLDHPKYFPYRFGQAFWAYVGGRYGDETIGRMLRAAGRGSVEAAIQGVLRISPEQLSKDWRQALIDEYEPVLKATVPAQKQGRVVIRAKRDEPGGLNVSPVLSPDGSLMAFFSERDIFSVDLYLADARTGEIKRKITETAVDPHYDSLQFVNSAGAWSADGKQFVFPSVSEGRPELAIYDVERDSVVRRFKLRQYGEAFSPTWSPDGRYIAFAALRNGYSDLAVLDLKSGSVRDLTTDQFGDMQPAWSPDGRAIAFVTDRFTSDLDALSFGDYRLALIDPLSGQITAAPAFENGKHINPQWSADARSLYFISDWNGISNVYRVALEGGGVFQITNLQTGASGISKLSPAISAASKADRIVFTAFEEGNYSIFAIEDAPALAGRPPADTLARLTPGLLPPREHTNGAVSKLLESPVAGLPTASNFQVRPYNARLGLDYFAPPNIGVGASNFGTLIGGGTALYWSDLLGYHNVMTAFQTATTGDGSNFFRNIAALAGYQNQRSRWTWGFTGGQVPFLSGDYGTGLVEVDGELVEVEQAVQYWQISRQFSGIVAYPFNRAQRVEFSGGYENIDFAAEETLRAFDPITGQLIARQRQDLPTAGSLNLGRASAALVYDTSIFGGTSPIWGQSYRLEFGTSNGSLNYTTALADYRRYFRIARPLTLAGRVLHFGRYGGDAEESRLQDMFIGYPSMVRGYTPGSFTVHECGSAAAESGACPVFDQLIGSRMAVLNAELRIPLLGFLGVIPSRSFPPVELAPFYDAGIAWTSEEQARLTKRVRSPVSSTGLSLRVNLLGFAIGQISYVHPMDRPAKSWVWEFSLIPGF